MVPMIRNREEFEHLVVTLHAEGWKIRALARHFATGRNTIRRILRKHQTRRDEGHDVLTEPTRRTPRGSKLDRFVPFIEQQLEEFPRITAQRLFEELRQQGYTGKISILRHRLQTLRPQPKRDPTVRFETAPGVQGQMDWSPYTIPFTRTGKRQVLCFSYILGYSRRQFIHFTVRRDFYTLIRRHRDAFTHFGGVPKTCLYDSEKTVVLRWEAGQPLLNPSFVRFITHYECRPVICRRARPQTKGKVEQPFRYVQSNLLNGRKFADLDDLRNTAQWWLRERSDPHPHDTTGRPPLELFLEDERSALTPLPLHPYDTSEVALRVCEMDGFLELETNRYSVPYDYVADILTLKVAEHEIFIYGPELQLIAQHERRPAGSRDTLENLAHRASRKVRYGLEPIQDAFLALGDSAEAFLAGLKRLHRRNPGFHARAILRLKQQFHCHDIHRALTHATRYHAFDAPAIERILRATASPRTLESIRNERARSRLQHALPQITQRPLTEYSNLLLGEENDGPKTPTGPHPDRDPNPSPDAETDPHGSRSG
jgi:transposase